MNRVRGMFLASIFLLLLGGVCLRGELFSPLSSAHGQDLPSVAGKGSPGPGPAIGSSAPSQINPSGLQGKLQTQIAKLQNAEKEEEKTAAKQELKATLEEIFNADMQARDAQVKEIDSRLTKLREQYKAREAAKDSIIDLQLAVLEKDASGLGFPFSGRGKYPLYDDAKADFNRLGYPKAEAKPDAPRIEQPSLSPLKIEQMQPSENGVNPVASNLLGGNVSSQGEFISEYEKLRDRYWGDYYALRSSKEMLKQAEEWTLTPGKEGPPGGIGGPLGGIGGLAGGINADKWLEDRKGNVAMKQWKFDETNRVLDVKLKLLALDLREAEGQFGVAESELRQAQQINEKNPSAVSPTEIGRLAAQANVSRIKLERAKTIYDLFASIKEDPKKEEQSKPETPAPESNSRAR